MRRSVSSLQVKERGMVASFVRAVMLPGSCFTRLERGTGSVKRLTEEGQNLIKNLVKSNSPWNSRRCSRYSHGHYGSAVTFEDKGRSIAHHRVERNHLNFENPHLNVNIELNLMTNALSSGKIPRAVTSKRHTQKRRVACNLVDNTSSTESVGCGPILIYVVCRLRRTASMSVSRPQRFAAAHAHDGGRLVAFAFLCDH
jgi:hypothetical protein